VAKLLKNPATIAANKKARFDYFIEDNYVGGLALEGWEVKALRAGGAQLKESYVKIHKNEIYLFGCHISPLVTASTHINPDPLRTRKILLQRVEINKLVGLVERKGYTLVALALFWQKGRAKIDIGLAKGKQKHDKRVTIKERDWKREQERLVRKMY